MCYRFGSSFFLEAPLLCGTIKYSTPSIPDGLRHFSILKNDFCCCCRLGYIFSPSNDDAIIWPSVPGNYQIKYTEDDSFFCSFIFLYVPPLLPVGFCQSTTLTATRKALVSFFFFKLCDVYWLFSGRLPISFVCGISYT